MPAADRSTGNAVASSRRAHLVAAVISALFVVLPLVAVRFPPITDLPQQLAQIRLGSEAVAGSSPYRLNLAAPGVLGYAPFALASLIAGPLVAGRLAYALVASLWVAGFALVAATRHRPASVVPLLALLVFSHPLYWGFASFLLGAALFCFWIVLERRLRAGPGGWGEAAALAAGIVVLYLGHAFWCLAGSLWLAAASFSAGLDRHRLVARLAPLAVPAVLAVSWSAELAASGFASETTWWVSPLGRLAPGELVDRILGGLAGGAEPVLVAALVLWIVLAVLAAGRDLADRSDLGLALVAALCLAAALLLPDRFQNTLAFAGRWTPVGLAFLVAALPAPPLRSWLRRAVPLVLLASLSVATVAAWQRFERSELNGLDESLAALPAHPAVLGLDFFRLSTVVKTQPFFQIPAYAQVLAGGTLGFSFASFPTSPVVFREWENPAWPPGLEWLPHQIFESMDAVRHFDVLLVHADPPGHEYFEQHDLLEPITEEGRWRLYRVTGGGGPS